MIGKTLKAIVGLNVKLTHRFDGRFPRIVQTDSYRETLEAAIENYTANRHFTCVLEVGGIDRPLLRRSENIAYEGMDIDYKNACGALYDQFYVQSIEESFPRTYDLITSHALLEHVPDNTRSIAAMHGGLRPGGCMVHYMPSKYHLYSLVLRLAGPGLQRTLITALRPWAQQTTGYPAFFDKCAPRAMKAALKTAGFTGIKVIPFYRAADYFRFFAPAYVLIVLWENTCKRCNWKQLCSGFVIIARKT